MKRSYTLSLGYFLVGIAALASVSVIKAQSAACDDISHDVTSAVLKDPSKVLMIVEDALVINEVCSCEIIKAAITASQADAALVSQIVQTAMSVAPKMSGVIMDCATSVSPGALALSSEQLTATETSGKDVKNPLPLIEPPAEAPDFATPPHVIPVFLPPMLGGGPPRKRKNDPISPVQNHHCYP
jgi:hypothetical protein